jgi:hypothetical protein
MTRSVLNIVLFLEITSGAFWTFSFAMSKSPGLETLGLFVLIYGVQAVCFLVGLWAYWRYPVERRKAGWILALPFVFLFLPGVLKNAAGGRLTESGLVALFLITATIVLTACLVIPRKVASKLPGILFRSRIFNSLFLLGPLLGWLFFIGILVWLFGVEGEATLRSIRRDATGYGVGSMIVIGAMYLIGLGCASLLSSAWAWLGLHSGVEDACRKLNIAQMIVAVPGLLIGGFAMFFFASQN